MINMNTGKNQYSQKNSRDTKIASLPELCPKHLITNEPDLPIVVLHEPGSLPIHVRR